ncbi:hypothetical protein PSEUBRA_001802 [Kalmanozyma brasiliensis GHG001]|uniref:Uncharacterized protein n=1 Tax=Kalmanozyma brasiliensis (strain GHG001) TaxID=1365824 RepID=V5EE21_KALBG|nr:uncharacterized protein PSEUBRA_001802 [Kalmanozyma brasiliensis GHG001]EST08721.1 hypothetical protein PSEUBRA_001802 [Kalmanozyma brasiliensis GHG001]
MSATSPIAPGGSSQPIFASVSGSTSKTQLYSLASRVPLIKSPSISLPKPVRLPQDLHPLPADISAYFVYPFSLESYVLDPNTPSSSTIDQLLAKHQQYLENREREKENKHKEMLMKMAPGWSGDVLLPKASGGAARESAPVATEARDQAAKPHQTEEQVERTPLDELADHLAQLDALNTTGAPSGGQSSQLP